MFGNSGQSNPNTVNVNTRTYSSFSDTAALTLSLWNDKISLKLSPLKGVNQDGLRQYAFDAKDSIITSITPDNAITLLEGNKTVIKPALDKKEAASISIVVNAEKADSKKIITLATANGEVTLSIHVNINADNSVSEGNTLSHKFNTRDLTLNYNPADGTGEKIIINSDYENFIKKIEDVLISSATAHSINYSNSIKSQYANKSSYSGSAPAANDYSAQTNNYGSSGFDNMNIF